MKKPLFLFMLLLLYPFINSVGQVSDAQKQEALSAVSNFCSLLSQFSNGGKTYLKNDAKIFEMCSSPKMSAYDDLKEKKEVMFNAYLSLITMTYKNHLQMNFSNEHISDISYIPIYEMGMVYSSLNESDDMGYMKPEFYKQGYSDIYIVVDVMQNIPSLNKSTQRKVIYSLAEKKIITFSNINSPYIDLCKAMDCYTKKDFKSVLGYCHKVITNERFDKKTACASLAILACFSLEDYSTLRQYIDYIPNKYKDGYITLLNFQEAIETDRYDDAFKYATILAESNLPTRSYIQIALGAFYSSGIGCVKDSEKATYWYKRAIKEGCPAAGYNLFIAAMQDDTGINLTVEEAIDCLTSSAELSYIPAYAQLGILYGGTDNIEEEEKWYKKSVEANDITGMIYYGNFLYVVKHNKKDAIYWFKKALNDNRFESYLSNRAMGNGIKSKNDLTNAIVRMENGEPLNLIRIHPENQNQPPTPPTTVVPVHHNSPTTSATSVSSSNNNPEKPRSRKYREPFNSPKSEYSTGGFSIGYVQKQWSYKSDGDTENVGYWDDSQQISGIQAGIQIEPLFSYGFGFKTGLFYEFYYSKSQPLSYEGETYSPTLIEHALYLPLHLEYRLNFSKQFQLFFYGGIGLDYGISAKIKTNNESLDFDDDNAYHDSDWKQFNASYEFGGGIRFNRFQLGYTMSKGLINMSKESGYSVKQNKNIMCSLSVFL